MTITNFLILRSDGTCELPADALGSNLAFCCSACGHPVLASALPDQSGSDEEHPAECKGCGERYFLDVRVHAEKLYIHDLGEPL
jgi:hypothetical protein